MKKILTLLVMVALAACWVSCSDDDDKNEPDPTIPTKNEITLTIKVNKYGKLDLFYPELFDDPEYEWEEEEAKNLKLYHKIPQDWEVNWGDGNTTNTTEHIYATEGTYNVTLKGTGITSLTPLEGDEEGCYIQNIDITKAPNLIILEVCYGEISALDISKNTALRVLSCERNSFTQETINNLLNSLPIKKAENSNPLYLSIDSQWDISIAKEKGWQEF